MISNRLYLYKPIDITKDKNNTKMANHKTDLQSELNTMRHYASVARKAANRIQYWSYLRGRIAQLHNESHGEIKEYLLDMYSFCFNRELRAKRDINSAVFHSKN